MLRIFCGIGVVFLIRWPVALAQMNYEYGPIREDIPEDELYRCYKSFFWWLDYLNREDDRVYHELSRNPRNMTAVKALRPCADLAHGVFVEEMDAFEKLYHEIRVKFDVGENGVKESLR